MKLMELLKERGIELNFDAFVAQKDWITDRLAVMDPFACEWECKPVDGILNLMNGVLQILSYENGNVGYLWLPVTEFIEGHCPKCEKDVKWKWNLRQDGLVAYCPHCGEKITFCRQCNYDRLNCIKKSCENQACINILAGDVELSLKLTAAGTDIDPEKFALYMDWLNDEYGSLSPSGSEATNELEGIIALMEAIKPVLENETGKCFYFPKTEQVTEYCSECESEVTLFWNVREDGIKAYCPVCGKRLMLCDVCPKRKTCDYEGKTDTCFFNKLDFH